MPTEITRKVEFDAGHRIPDHQSLCRNVHGHRYVLEVTLRGPVNQQAGQSDTGMVMDFGSLKKLLEDLVTKEWDHAFLCYVGDSHLLKALEMLGPQHRTVVLDCIPTVENLAGLAAERIQRALEARKSPSYLIKLRLYETPNCWADFVLEPRHTAVGGLGN